MAETQNQGKVPKGRSPSYPGVSLDVAIAKAEKLFDAQRDHLSRPDVVLGHMGYSPKSGAGLVTLAALKKFGLLRDEGVGQARKVGLSETGLRIVRDKRPGSTERAEALKRAALTPPVHKEVWERYHGSLPDEGALTFYLEMERSFTPGGAKDFVAQFKRTIAFAGLSASDTLTDNDGDTDTDHAEDSGGDNDPPNPPRKLRVTPADPSLVTVAIPLPTKPWAAIELPENMTEDAWNHMLRFFEFMKPSVVKEPEPEEHTGYQD